MRQLNGVYTQRFNRRHRRPGHVFQGRFKGILVDKPARSGALYRAESRPGGHRGPAGRLALEQLFGNGRPRTSRGLLVVAEGTGTASPWRRLVSQVLLGEQAFVQRFKDRLGEKEQSPEIPRQQRYAGRPSLAEIFAPRRRVSRADRNRGMHHAHMHHGYTLKQIAEHLGLHYTTVSKAVQVVEVRRRV